MHLIPLWCLVMHTTTRYVYHQTEYGAKFAKRLRLLVWLETLSIISWMSFIAINASHRRIHWIVSESKKRDSITQNAWIEIERRPLTHTHAPITWTCRKGNKHSAPSAVSNFLHCVGENESLVDGRVTCDFQHQFVNERSPIQSSFSRSIVWVLSMVARTMRLHYKL